jgi:hypothetical protein
MRVDGVLSLPLPLGGFGEKNGYLPPPQIFSSSMEEKRKTYLYIY